MAKAVFKSLLVDEENSYYVRDEKRGNRIYKIFFDPKSRNYFWKLVECEIDIEDNIFFNMKYNHCPEVVYVKDGDFENKGKKEYRKEIFNRKRQKIISILVSAVIPLVVLNSCNVATIETPTYTEPSQIVEITDEVDIKKTYDWEEIKSAIEENPNLTEQEKEFLYKIQFVFDENYEYMDLEQTIYRLKKLSITYVNDINNENASVVGKYNRRENKITIFLSKSFSDVNICVFLHEFFHVLQAMNKNQVNELSNELFTREVLRRLDAIGELDGLNIDESGYSYGAGYEPYMYIYYYLAELIPQETLKEYQFGTAWDDILVNALCESVGKFEPISDEKDLAWELIDLINDALLNNYYSHSNSDRISEIIEYFYQLNGKNAEFDFFNSYMWMDISGTKGELLLEKMNKNYYMEYDNILGLDVKVQNRTYFSDAFPENLLHCHFGVKYWVENYSTTYTKMFNIFKSNGDDFDKDYIIALDEQFGLDYSSALAKEASKYTK